MATAFAGLITMATSQYSAVAQTAKASPPAPSAVAPPSELGLWIDHTGRGAVTIAPCGDKLCGHIAWLKDPNDEKGQPLRDLNNPVKGKRGQTICGLQILGDLKKSGRVWDYGWIYDPEKGEKYDLEIRLKSADTLQVTGYLGVKFLSETFLWKRAPEGMFACPPPAVSPAPVPNAAPAPVPQPPKR
ncbi:MAG TPA: DUF2147 domain-containing protein [Hyphomicrobiaceae bacterium]|nr:DUF2147 domain-containing protein [Hyphomicrobiaceae bacterium]